LLIFQVQLEVLARFTLVRQAMEVIVLEFEVLLLHFHQQHCMSTLEVLEDHILDRSLLDIMVVGLAQYLVAEVEVPRIFGSIPHTQTS
jgi:hypothetical protein